jgi:diguanylate cyclase (GGDEF)-like protein
MVRPRDFSIRAKLSSAFGLSLALIFAIGAISLVQLWGLNALATDVTKSWLPKMEMLGKIKREMTEHEMLARRRANTTNFRTLASDSARMAAIEDEVEESLRRFRSLANGPADLVLLAVLTDRWGDYRRSLATAFARLDAGDLEGAQREVNTATGAAFNGAMLMVDDLLTASREAGQSAAQNVRSVYGLSLTLILAVLAFATATVGAAVYWISTNVSRPILRISHAMQRLTVGDNSVSVSEGRDRKDEIGVLVGAVSGYRNSIERARLLGEQAEIERQRLDTALNNMAQGLCLFDAEQRLVMFNQRFVEIFHLPPGKVALGMYLDDLFQMTHGMQKDPVEAMLDKRRFLASPASASAITELVDGRSISITHRPMANGGFVATFDDITDRLAAEERIRHLAHYDPLTDLPNRVTFYERIEKMLAHLRRSESVAVLSLDLDHFKNVNDTLGHPVGDRLLRAAADRMRSCVREDDIVARLGGDEFAIVQAPSEQTPDITHLSSRLIETVGAPYDIDGHQIMVGVSVGIAVAPADGNKPDVLMRNADLALYRAKKDGGGAYRFFEMGMDARMQARRALEIDLRKAVMRGEFEVHYQPIIDVRTGHITACEALVRWNHPTRGKIPPLEFIPVAEETGLIVQIGQWVLQEACAEAARWPNDVVLAVNLSPVQFKNRNLPEVVTSALANSGLPAERLELEITELVLLQESDGAFATLHQLRDLGIKIAMDDFGTGYSSLGYLRSFPFDKIKIDQSFIRDLPSKEGSIAIVRAVVGLSSSLGITAIAEGVETKEQFESLAAEGCNEVQGYLFSPPRPAAEIMQMLAAQRAPVDAVA